MQENNLSQYNQWKLGSRMMYCIACWKSCSTI